MDKRYGKKNQFILISSLSAALFFVSGCSTMHFTQEYPEIIELDEPKEEIWHNTTLNGTVEISRPVNLYKQCNGSGWARASVEFNADNILITALTNGIMDITVPALSLVNFYAPWDVEVQCIK